MSALLDRIRRMGQQAEDDVPEAPAVQMFQDDHGEWTHTALSGRHAHPHSSYRTQGGDVTHEHEHTHQGDHNHNHHQVVVAHGAMPLGPLSYIEGSIDHPDDHPHDMVPLVAASMSTLGSSWGVAQRAAADFAVLAADGSVSWTATTYAEAVGLIGQQLASRGSAPVLAETWRSDMAFEGVQTEDGRFIRAGAIEYRDTPLPLMLQTETAGGHMGAVLAGSITKTGMLGSTAVGSGDFDDSDAGQQFVDIINARGKFGVSIDVAEAEGEFVCTEYDENGDCQDGRVEFSLIRIMGVTGTPFPAFADAYIEIGQAAPAQQAQQAQTASGEPECVECLEAEGTGETMTPVDAPADGSWHSLTASGAAPPPSDWFADPGFQAGDERMVRQPDGGWLCPLTITADGRVFGHVAGHRTCHTGYANRCVIPPRSRTGYAAFMLRPLMTADGSVVKVGQLTMGAGHADQDPRTPLDAVRAHYDGAPGAVQLASVCVGEDQFGIWMAGAVNPEVTAEQIERGRRMSVSGDWREVWRGRGLDMVAVAAGVPVPGFPIAAAGYTLTAESPAGDWLPEPTVRYLDGRPVVLVAAGVVRQPMPWERMIGAQQDQIDQLGRRLEAAERVTAELRGEAARRIRDSIG